MIICSKLPELILTNSKGFAPIVDKNYMLLTTGEGSNIFIYSPKLIGDY